MDKETRRHSSQNAWTQDDTEESWGQLRPHRLTPRDVEVGAGGMAGGVPVEPCDGVAGGPPEAWP